MNRGTYLFEECFRVNNQRNCYYPKYLQKNTTNSIVYNLDGSIHSYQMGKIGDYRTSGRSKGKKIVRR